MDYILAIDQGTSGTKAIVFDESGKLVCKGSRPLKSSYPRPGFVEQDPEEIYLNALESTHECLVKFESLGHRVAGLKTCGITNQRETFLLWDYQGKPLTQAIVWQCKRSVDICNELLKDEALCQELGDRTGLIFDPYFSGTKLLWLLQNDQDLAAKVEKGEVFFGTIDTWLLYRLTNGKVYATDHTNASRTLFFNIKTLAWDQFLIEKLGVSRLNFPKVFPSSHYFGETDFEGHLATPLSIHSLAGDSHAAAFGEGCYSTGTAKATMGTGCSILVNTGDGMSSPNDGMLSTICWSTQDQVANALEGAIVSCGSTLQWLVDQFNIKDVIELTERATSLTNSNGVYVIPAFSGLGAPHWDMERKASIVGLTFDSSVNHILRAGLDSVSYQIKDVVEAIQNSGELRLNKLMVDGGISANPWVMQFLADLLGIEINAISHPDISALGAAYLAGLSSGVYQSIRELNELNTDRKVYHPTENNRGILEHYAGWCHFINKK